MPGLSEDDVAGVLKAAVAAVDASDVPSDLRAEAFKSAVTLLSGVGAPAAMPSPQHQTPAGDKPAKPPAGGDDSPLGRLAAYLDLPTEQLHHVFAVHDEVPRLALKAAALPGSKKAAATDIVLMTMAARQGAGEDGFTSPETLKAEAQRYGKYDPTNFGKSLTPLSNLVQTEGKPKSLSRKLTQPGIEAASRKVAEYIEAATSA